MAIKLTDDRIRKLPAKDALVRDVESPLAVRVSRNGHKSLVVVWRHRGRVRKAHICRVGDMMLDDARNEARKRFKAQLDGGGVMPTPSGTVAELAEVYQKRHSDEWGRLHRRQVASSLRTHILPTLGELPADRLSRSDCNRWFEGLKDAGVKPAARGRALEMLRAMLKWAIVSDRIPGPNPTDGIKRPPKGKRTRVLEPDELVAYESALRDAPDPNGADACRLLAITGLRVGTVASILWSQVDLERGVIRFHKDQMKSGRDFTKNICLDAIDIISRQPRTGDLVFPPPPDQKGERVHVGDWVGTVRKYIDKVSSNAQEKAGITGATPCHVFRHGFESYGLKKLRIPEAHMNAMMDHETQGMIGIYGHLDAESVRQDEERLQAYLADMLYDRKRDNVVPIPRNAQAAPTAQPAR